MSELDRALTENPRKRVKREFEEPDDLDVDSEDEDQKPEAEPAFQNHPTFYFDDGNIILRTGGTLFCVHRSLLAMHSSVFRELFRQDNERFRGLAHYTMEETREDLEALLKVIYQGLHVDVKQLSVETFPMLATVLRMASKYKIERPCVDIVARIRQQWPAALAEHDAVMTDVRATVVQHLGADNKDKGKAPEGGLPNFNGGGHNANANTAAQIEANYAFFQQYQAHQNKQQNMPWGHPQAAMRGGPSTLFQPVHGQPFQAGGPQLNQPADQTMLAHNRRPPPPQLTNLIAQMHRDMAKGEQNDRGPVAGPSNANANGHANPANPDGPAQNAAAAAPAQKEDLIIHPASVIAVLRECGYRDAELLFPLFYALSRTTAQFGGAALGHHLAPLSAADMERFVVGIERLRARHTALVVAPPAFDVAQGSCGAWHSCRAGSEKLWAGLVHTLLVTNEGYPHEPIEEWQDMVASVNAQHARFGICGECSKSIVAKIQAHRASLWAELPEFFELV